MQKVVTIHKTTTGTVLRWVQERQVLHLAGTLPAVWLKIIQDKGYTIKEQA